jgi:hypothetical protein
MTPIQKLNPGERPGKGPYLRLIDAFTIRLINMVEGMAREGVLDGVKTEADVIPKLHAIIDSESFRGFLKRSIEDHLTLEIPE